MKKYLMALLSLGILGCTSNAASSNTLYLQGEIHMKGSSRSTFLSIKDQKSGVLYKIQNPSIGNLSQKQNQLVRVEAKLAKKAIGPGFPATIQIIKVSN